MIISHITVIYLSGQAYLHFSGSFVFVFHDRGMLAELLFTLACERAQTHQLMLIQRGQKANGFTKDIVSQIKVKIIVFVTCADFFLAFW